MTRLYTKDLLDLPVGWDMVWSGYKIIRTDTHHLYDTFLAVGTDHNAHVPMVYHNGSWICAEYEWNSLQWTCVDLDADHSEWLYAYGPTLDTLYGIRTYKTAGALLRRLGDA